MSQEIPLQRIKYRSESVKLWIALVTMAIIVVWISRAYAADYHQRGQGVAVVYTITTTGGKPVTGETVRLQVERMKDGLILDHATNTFASSGWTTRYATMNYDPKIEAYVRVVSIDSSLLVSGDYAMAVSNDSVTYSDHQTEIFTLDTIPDIIKINR